MGRPFSREFRGRGGEDFLIQEHEREEKEVSEEKEAERIIDDYSTYLNQYHEPVREKFDLVENLIKKLEPYFRTVPELDKYLVRANFYRFFDEVDYDEDDNMFRSVPKTFETFLEFYERFKIPPDESFKLSSTNFELPLKHPREAVFLEKIKQAKKQYPELDAEDKRRDFIEEQIKKYSLYTDEEDLIKELLSTSGIALNKEFALKLDNAHLGWVVLKNLDIFSGLDKELAENLINSNRDYDTAYRVIENKKRFDNFVLDKKLALNLINSGRTYLVFTYLENFIGIDEEILNKLLKDRFLETLEEVIKNPNKYPWVSFDKETIYDWYCSYMNNSNRKIFLKYLEECEWPKSEYGEEFWEKFKKSFTEIFLVVFLS